MKNILFLCLSAVLIFACTSKKTATKQPSDITMLSTGIEARASKKKTLAAVKTNLATVEEAKGKAVDPAEVKKLELEIADLKSKSETLQKELDAEFQDLLKLEEKVRAPLRKEAHAKTKAYNESVKPLEELHKVKIDLPYWEVSALEFKNNFDQAIADIEKIYDAIAALKPNEVTFENTLGAFEETTKIEEGVISRMYLMDSLSNDSLIREMVGELIVKYEKWGVDISFREDIYASLKAYQATNPNLSGERKKYYDDVMLSYKLKGMDKPDAVRKEIIALQKELSGLTKKIEDNIKAGSKNEVYVTQAEAACLTDADLIKRYKKNDAGDFIVYAGVSNFYFPFLEKCTDEAVRKRVYIAQNQIAQKTNPPLMEKVIKLRAKLGRLLGFDSYADSKLAVKMAKNADTANKFLDRLKVGLQPKLDLELKTFAKLKADETGNANVQVHPWDYYYYMDQVKKKQFQVDTTELKKFFEYEATLQGMYKVFEKIFKLKIEEVQAPYVWDEKLALILISDSQTKKPLGYMYLDMFPRPEHNKYSHFAMASVRHGRLFNGVDTRPITSFLCNFPEPKDGKPAFLTLDNVTTLFHEFGHGLHGVLSTAELTSHRGTQVPRDFVEAPSQMLEYFTYSKDVLDMFAVNYYDPTETIPADIIKKIPEAEKATKGIYYRRQLSFGIMDMRLHSKIDENDADFDIIKFTNDVLKEVWLDHTLQGTTEQMSFITNFGHLFGGYDAGYYGYAWADAIAADMASVFENAPDGYLDEAAGMKLRKEIYEVGDSKSITEAVETFLGREQSIEPFLKKLGIEEAKAAAQNQAPAPQAEVAAPAELEE